MRKVLRIVIPAVFYTLLVVFLVVYLTTVDFQVLAQSRLDVLPLAIGTVIALLGLYGYVGVWILILRSLGARVRWTTTLSSVYARAWLGRYIPGKVPWILGKIYFASRQGIPRSTLAVSSTLEAALQIVAQLLLALALLAFDVRLDVVDPVVRALLILLMLACVVVVLPPVFNRILRIGMRLLRREPPVGLHVGWRTIGSGIGAYVPVVAVNGVAAYLVARAVDPSLGPEFLLFVTGAYILSGVVGILAIFAPSGLGVREGLLLLLLTLVTEPGLALVVTVLLRLWSVALDALFAGSAVGIDLIARRRSWVAPSEPDDEGMP